MDVSAPGLAVCVAGGALAIAMSCSSAGPSTPAGTAASSMSTRNPDWPNEPAGLVVLTNRAWTELAGGGWNHRYGGDDRIVEDAGAPFAPAMALEYVYPVGFAGGTAPAMQYYPLRNARELFVGLTWKASDPWQGHSTFVNKIQFVYTPTSDITMVMYGPVRGPYELRVMPQWPEHRSVWLTGNVTNTPPALGQWHRLQWYLKYESSYGAADGIVRWWLDGSLAGDYSNIRYPHDAGFTEYQISPTWGGVGDVKTEADFYRFNRSYISSR